MRPYFIAALIACSVSFGLQTEALAEAIPQCSLLLKPADQRYKSYFVKSMVHHYTIEKTLEGFSINPGQGFASDWINTLTHITHDYFKFEVKAFTSEADFSKFISLRDKAVKELIRNLSGVSFGNLRTPLSMELWHLQDALIAYAEDEAHNFETSQDVATYLASRHRNLTVLKRELENIVVHEYSGRRFSAISYLVEYRDIWLSFVNLEIKAISPFVSESN